MADWDAAEESDDRDDDGDRLRCCDCAEDVEVAVE